MAADLSAQIISSVKDAHASEQSLVISGQGSKSAWLPDAVIGAGGSLDVTGHSGIQAYQPEELVITARAGTSLEEINDVFLINFLVLFEEEFLLKFSLSVYFFKLQFVPKEVLFILAE